MNHGSFSLVAQPRIVVARDQASWEELWDLQGSASQRPGPLPDLNLRKEMAIGVFLGQRPSPGYDLEWISCEDRDGVTHLLVRELDTDPHRLLPLAVTYPYRIFRVPRTEGPVQVQFD